MAIPDNLKRAIRDGKTIPFVGAGVSMAVKVETGGTTTSLFPSWKQLLDKAADSLKTNNRETEAKLVQTFLELRPPKYLEAAKYAYDAFAPDDWYGFLKSNLDPDFSEDYEGLELARAIWALSNNLIITTNYDNVLSWACPRGSDVKKWFIQSPVQQAEFLRRNLTKPTVWHLHGGIDEPETIILTPDGYSRLYPVARSSETRTEERFQSAFDTLQSVMREYTLLFIGYSLDDKEIGDQLRLVSETFQGATGHHFMLVRRGNYQEAEQRLSKLGMLIELVPFEEFGPNLIQCVEELAALKNKPSALPAEPGITAPASSESFPPLSISSLPILDKSAFERLFIGRERLLGDIRSALTALQGGARYEWGDQRADDVQLFWIHGFGGMGKSWLLRRAYIEAEERFPDVRLALIDWDAPKWREPLAQPPFDNEQLFKVIAYRLAQLFGVDALRPYWAASARVHATKERYTDLQVDFFNTLDQIIAIRQQRTQPSTHAHDTGEAEEASETDRRRRLRISLEKVLRGARLWSDNSETFLRLINNLRADQIRMERIFETWAEQITESGVDCAIFQPGRLLAEALRECLRRLTDLSPILLILDTCEVLSPELDWWLRHLLAPLLDDGHTPLLVIIGSRQKPDASIREGRSEGWLAEVPDRLRRIVAFDEHVRFTVDEIGRALRKLRRPPPPDPELAALLHRATLGFPLALRALFDFHEDGDDVLSELAFLQEELEDWDSTPAMRRVYEKVSNRFLLHLERDDREEELRDVTALALFRKARVEHLKRFWDCANIKDRLRRLELRYSLVADGDLHATVRGFLRRRWRDDPPERLLDIARQFANIVQESEPSDGFDEPNYMEWMMDRCEVASWLEGQGSFPLFTRTLAVALTFDHDPQPLAALASEVPITTETARRSKRILTSLSDSYLSFSAWRSFDVLQWLNQQQSGKWNEMERASLELLNGLALASRSRHAEAIQRFQSAFPVFVGKSLPRRRQIAQAYHGAVKDMGQSMVAVAEEAYQWTNKVDLINSESWDENYYWVIHNAHRYEEAESYCRRVIHQEPSNLSARHYLGHILHKHLRRAGEAEEEYRRILEIDDDDLTSHTWLGDLLKEQDSRWDEAEAEYRKALKLTYSSESKVKILKQLAHLLSNNHDKSAEAEALCREAVVLATDKEDKAYILYLLGYLLTYRLKKPEKAEEALREGLKLVVNPITKVNMLKTLAHLLTRSPDRREEGWTVLQEALLLAPEDSKALNSLAWSLYTANTKLDEAEQLSTRSVTREPENLNYLHTLAAILIRLDKWTEAIPHVQRWVQKVSAEHVKTNWHDFQPLFCDALKNGHAIELAALLECRNDNMLWTLLRYVLQAAVNGSKDFTDLPSHLQGSAMRLLEQLLSYDATPIFPDVPDAPKSETG